MKQWLTLLDAYFSVCLGCDIGAVVPGETRVSASSRREKRELHYADVFPGLSGTVTVFASPESQARCAGNLKPQIWGR
jgi:hypothetical protein